MAVFPPYEPDERSYGLGAHPVVTQRGWAGGAMRFRTGSVRVGAPLRLTFRRLVEAAAKDIRDHYAGQFSSGQAFQRKCGCFMAAKARIAGDPRMLCPLHLWQR